MDCLPQLHVAAIHAEPGFRSAVPGIGVLCRKDDLLAGIGIYSNSIGARSNYAIVGYQPWTVGSVRFGGIVGMVDGYPMRNGGVIPMAAGVVSWDNIHMTIIPELTGVTPWTFQLSFTL